MSETKQQLSATPGERKPPSRRLRLAATIVSSDEKLLVPCLDTLLKYRPMDCDFKIYVAWNAPSRGLPRLAPELALRYPDVEMIESFTPGYPFNQNLLLNQADADYYLVLNDDLIFLPGSIDKPLNFMARPDNARIGLLTIRLLNADGSLQPSTYSFAGLLRTVWSVSNLRNVIPLSAHLNRVAASIGLGRGRSRYWSHEETVEIESCRGAYMLVRDDALRQVGVFDLEGGHETEWHVRFHQRGWKIVFYHEAEVIHLGSMTVSRDPEKDLLNLESFLNIYYKHMPGWRYVLMRASFFVTYLARYLGAALWRDVTSRRIARKGMSMVVRWPQRAE